MQRLTIARFDPVRTANIVAALYAVIVLVIGALFAIPFGLVALVAGERAGGSGVAAGGAFGILVLLVLAVVFYAGVGWVITAITCALYNWLAGRIGGIQVDVRNEGTVHGGGIPAWGAQPAPYAVAPGQPAPGTLPPGTLPPGTQAPAGDPGAGGPPQPPAGWGSPG